MMKKSLFLLGLALSVTSVGCVSHEGPTPEQTLTGSSYDWASYKSESEVREYGDYAQKDIVGQVFFSFDGSTLSTEDRRALDIMAEKIKSSAYPQILVIGYSDGRGKEGYNYSLGEKRAVAVKNYLISRGVNATSMRAESRGSQSAGRDRVLSQYDRRVDVVISPVRH